MANDKIRREDTVEDKVFDIGKDYAKSLQPAIDANDEWFDSFDALTKVALQYLDVDKQFAKASGRSDFLKAKQEEEKLRKLAAQAQKAESDAEKKAIEVKNRLLDSEKKLLDIEAKKERAKRVSTKLTIAERLERTRDNREKKDEAILNSRTSSLMDILNVKRKRAIRTIQDLVAKKKLGEKLSNTEQRELSQSTIQFNKYDLAIRKAKETTRQFQENVGNYPKQFGIAGSALKKLLPLVGGFLTLRAAFDFAKESRQLAIDAKGVEFAFQKIETRTKEAEKALISTKELTRGLLSDLDIKKSIVEFDNFGLAVNEIDGLLEFVAVRAAQTGKSFEGLRDSLVEGLSKESKLRIDNLGISTAELNAELAKTPKFIDAVANIAKREVKEAGDILDDAGNSQKKWNADLENFQLLVGNKAVAGFSDLLFTAGSNMLRAITPTKRMSDAVREQQLELNILVQKITATNIGEQERADKIDLLQTKYPGFLKNLDAEKTTNEQIRDRLAEVNKAYVVKIALTDLEQNITEKAAEAGEKLSDSFELEERARKKLIKTIGLSETNRLLETKSLREATDEAVKNAGVTEELLKDANKFERQGVKILTSKQRALLEVQSALRASTRIEGESNDITKEANGLEEQRNRFLEKYKDILEDINSITGNPDPIVDPNKDLDEKELERLRKLAEARRKAAIESKFAIESFGLQERIDDLNRVAEAESNSFDVRKGALIEISEVELELAELTATKKLQLTDKFTSDEIDTIISGGVLSNETLRKIKDDELLLIAEFQSKKKSIERDGENAVDNLDVEKFRSQSQQRLLVLEKELDEELALANEALKAELDITANRERAIEEHEKKVAEIRKLYAVRGLDEQVKAVEQLLRAEEISAEKRAELERQLAALKLEISNITTESFIQSNEKEVLSTREKVEQILSISQALADALVDLANSIFEARIQKIDEEIEASDEKTERLLNNENLNDEQRAEIEKRGEERRAALEKKKREEQRKQAILNKALAITDIAIATALGIMQSYAQLGPIAGNFGAILVAALGAIQTAAVIAKPIPKYAKGTNNHPGGMALVGEERPEVISEPGVDPYVVSKPTVLDLKRGTVVTPSVKEYKDLMRDSAVKEIARNHTKVLSFNNNMLNDNSDLIDEIRLSRKAFEANKTKVNVYQKPPPDFNFGMFRHKNINWD